MKKSNNNLLLFFVVIIAGLVLDILSKQIIRLNEFTTSGHFVDISNLFNTGSLFGLFSSVNFVNIIFISISVIALFVLFIFQKQYPNLTLPLALMSAGVLGNLIDRILYGAVFDFINFHFWPVFNLADSFIVCGVVIALFILAKEELNKN
jgi:signal peptidase II